jgi:hypothetical protein
MTAHLMAYLNENKINYFDKKVAKFDKNALFLMVLD